MLALKTSSVVGKSSVTIAWPGDRHAVIDVLVRAFEADPVARWWFPDPRSYRPTFRAFAAAFGGRAIDHGTAQYVRPFLGAALWLPPGVGPDEQALIPLLEREVPDDRIRPVFMMLEKMGRHHPDEPHWYLPLIGVDPAYQGRSHGSALLRHATDRLDRAGQVAYLESTNPLNVPLYRRHGFEPRGTIQVADCPPVFPMVRYPR